MSTLVMFSNVLNKIKVSLVVEILRCRKPWAHIYVSGIHAHTRAHAHHARERDAHPRMSQMCHFFQLTKHDSRSFWLNHLPP